MSGVAVAGAGRAAYRACRRVWLVVAVALLAVCALAVRVSSASALTPHAGWDVTASIYPTNLPPGGSGYLIIRLNNTGGAASAEAPVVRDTLPAGVSSTGGGNPPYEHWTCSGGAPVTCTVSDMPALAAGAQVETEELPVTVAAGASGTGVNRVTVEGEGRLASAEQPVTLSSSSSGFGFAGWKVWFSNADGTLDTQAGSHPYEAAFGVDFNSVPGNFHTPTPAGAEERNIETELPPGFVGDPAVVPQCTRQLLDTNGCSPASQVGQVAYTIEGFHSELHSPLYNVVPPPNVPAQFALSLYGSIVILDVSVRSGGDYGLTAHLRNLPQDHIAYADLILWGEPASPSHNAERCGVVDSEYTCGVASSGAVKPFLTMPTSCEGQLAFTIHANTWQNAETAQATDLTQDPTGTPIGITGCEDLAFGPFISVAPDTTAGDTPAGLTTDLKVPQQGLLTPGAVATSDLRDGTVVLPEGVVISPGRASGLAACPLAQDGVGEEGPPSCPVASQVGTAQVTTPLLPDKLEGDVYVLQSNPPHVKLLIAIAGDGVEVKLVGNVSLDPVTGRLTTTFSETPALPFTDFKLSFSGGAQAALATPNGCGLYTATSDFTPWSSPFVEDALSASAFQITSGPDGSPCASPAPFTPSMIAGATTDQAGGYTDFTMLLSRGDGQQRIARLQFKTPEGLLGMISHVSLCEEPQAAQGECPESSQIGHTVVGAGPGPYQLYIPEAGQPPAPIYVTGPYDGAPYGLAIVVPVIAGPFNLGTTVVRGRIEVDPQTSQLTITTDPLPTILDGVPTDLRTIDAVIDRQEFMFNPTNCNPQAFSGTATSAEGATAALSTPFQVGSCRSLGFKPTFKVSTSAHTSRTEGASLHVSLTLPDEGGLSSEANVQRVKVSLPKQLPSPLKTLQKACLEKTFAENPKDCPVAAQVGQVKVSTPVLPGGLSGTAYFVSHGGAKYPELIMVLVGQNGVTVQVHGETFISKAGITTATFATVPDVPFSGFELTLPQRQYPALTANGNLCKGTLIMPTEIVGQNGLVIKQSTKISVTGCPKSVHKKAKKEAHRKAAKGRGKGKKKG